jgi:hypothetical protein
MRTLLIICRLPVNGRIRTAALAGNVSVSASAVVAASVDDF